MNILKNYNKELDWNIGSLFAHDDFVWKVLGVMKELGVETNIKYVFGSIPCLLQGGRVPPRDSSIENAKKIIDKYNSFGVSCRLTFSNTKIKEEAYEDTLSNQLLSILEENNKKYSNIHNGVMVSLDSLKDFIKKKYPSLEIIASLVKTTVENTLGRETADYYNNLLKEYDIVVMNPAKISDIKLLSEIQDKDRIEFIVNHRCLPNCPLAKQHYESMMILSNRALANLDTREAENRLVQINSWCLKERREYPLAGTSYSIDDIKFLIEMGFKHFKIEGRDNDGITFIRDLGDYIFESSVFNRLSHAIMEHAI